MRRGFWLMKPEAHFKAQLVTAVVTGVLVLAVMTVVVWRTGLSPLYLVPVLVAVALWPISLVMYRREVSSQSPSKPPVLLAVIGWLLISAALLIVNYWEERSVTWAIYPTAGAFLWPVSMILYSRLVDHYNR
jgi:uncharacterized membrane protein YoaK (UPF0700 family)